MTPPQSSRPPFFLPHFTWSMMVGSLVTWAFVRVAAMAAMGGAANGAAAENPLRLNPVAALFMIAVVAVLGRVSARRRNEDAFLLCLGYSRARQTAMFVGPVALAELVMAIVL